MGVVDFSMRLRSSLVLAGLLLVACTSSSGGIYVPEGDGAAGTGAGGIFGGGPGPGGGGTAGCLPGTHACSCGPTGLCNVGLTCLGGTCVNMTAMPPITGGAPGTGAVPGGYGGYGGLASGGRSGGGGFPGRGGAGGSIAPPPMCPLDPGAPACLQCLEQRCCGPLITCQSNSACGALVQCLQSCATGDTACEDRCATQQPAGVQPLLDLFSCLNGPCGPICNPTTPPPPPVRDAGPPTASCPSQPGDSVCQVCLDGKCCAPLQACLGNRSCTDLLACLDACSPNDAACEDKCSSVYGAGVLPLLDLANCASGPCGPACSSQPPPPITDAGAPGVCVSTPDATECRRCIDSGCCAQLNACTASLDCPRLISCLSNCNDGDSVCQDNCVNASTAQGVNLLINLFRCVDSRCTAAGGGSKACDPEPAPDAGVPPTDTGPPVCTDPTGATSCRVCLDQRCCAQVQACVSPSSACAQFGQCLNMCGQGDVTCENNCAAKFPAGVQPVDQLDQCGSANCAQYCGP